MSAVTGFHRLPILAIAALLAAGCGAKPGPSDPMALPSTAPTRSAPPSAGPIAAQSARPGPAVPTLAPLPTPAKGCIALDDVDLTRLDVELSSLYPNGDGGFGGFSIGLVNGELRVTRIEELSGQQRSALPPPRLVSNGRGLMLGGRDFVTFPSAFSETYSPPQSMIDASMTLALDGAPEMALPTRFVPGNKNFNQVAVTVPDVAGRGSVAIAFAWADKCFRYEASGTIPVDVVPLEQTAGCDLDEVAYWDELHAFLEGSIKVGTTTPRVGSAFNESKFAPYVNPGIDAFIGYMYDPEAPEQIVASGGTLRIETLKKRLHLDEKLTVVVWTRRSIANAVKDYPPRHTVEIFEGRLARQPDSSYELPVPDAPGRYVAALSVKFDSPCTTGTLWSVVNIEVT